MTDFVCFRNICSVRLCRTHKYKKINNMRIEKKARNNSLAFYVPEVLLINIRSAGIALLTDVNEEKDCEYSSKTKRNNH